MGKDIRKAIYPGSFDPITNGHMDIIHRASDLFDELIIAVASNDSKKSLLSKHKRVEILQNSLSEEFVINKDSGTFTSHNSSNRLKIDSFEGLLVDYAKKKNIFTIIRGLRTLSDFDYEFRMAIMNRNLDKSIETVFLMTDEKYSHISSSSIKEVYTLGGDINPFVPEPVVRNLSKIGDEKNSK